MMVAMTAQQAAIKAKEYLLKLLGKEPPGIILEEVELVSEFPPAHWLITLSYLEYPNDPDTFLASQSKRVYKEFKVMDLDGSVTSMKIRNLK